MRKLLLPGLAIASLIVACENKAPTGPGGVGPGGVTVSLTTTTTTTSTTTTTVPGPATPSSTTTSVTGSLSRRYITSGGAPNVPSDMQVLFQLLTGTLAPTSLLERLPLVGEAFATATEIRYKVTGTYVTPSGATGSIEGDLFGPSDPIQNGGEFHGVLRTTVGSCTAERVFRGPMGPFSLNLQGGETMSDCTGSPLSFAAVTMTQSNTPPPPTTSIAACSFTVSPTTVQVPEVLSSSTISVTASAPTCAWAAQSLASWLTLTPATGTGSGTVQFTASANSNGPQRSGTLSVAGQVVTVTQLAATPADLLPLLAETYCSVSQDERTAFASIRTRNAGPGTANAPSFTRLLFDLSSPPVSDEIPPLAAAQDDLSIFTLPASCFGPEDSNGFTNCAFTVNVDASNSVYEGAAGSAGETNNTARGVCRLCPSRECSFVIEGALRKVR